MVILFQNVLNSGRANDDQRDALKRNAVDVKVVFEASRSDSRQDFADCGKAKSIPKSLITTFDVRDKRNQRSRELVKNSVFLAAYVDATASNLNLSSKSRMIWSMRAIRMFVAHVVDPHCDESLTEAQKTEGAKEFFDALVRHLPQLQALHRVRGERDPAVTTGSSRDLKGGDVSLRCVGIAIFARAFLECQRQGISYDDMARKLATIDWHLLTCEHSDVPTGPTFPSDLQKVAQPILGHLLVIGENRYRVSSSSTDVDAAREKIMALLFVEDREAA